MGAKSSNGMICKQSAGHMETYYLAKDPLTSPDIKGGNITWVGSGCEKLGLKEGATADFQSVLNLAFGFTPDGETRLVGQAGHEAYSSTEVLLSFPKSVSLLMSYNEEFKDDMFKALSNSASNIENYTKGRQQVDGKTEEVDGKMIGFLALHSVNRNGEISFHGHINQMNMTIRPDGSFCCTENKALFDNRGNILQDFYNEMSTISQNKYGIELEFRANKTGEIIPEIKGIMEMKPYFCSRHDEIASAKELRAELMEKMPDAHPRQIDSLVQLYTKAQKDETLTAQGVLDARDMKAEMAGFDGYAIAKSVVGEKVHEKQMTATEYINTVVKDINKGETLFTELNVLNKAVKLSGGDYARAELLDAWKETVKSGDVISHGDKFTTPAMYKLEHGIADRVVEQKDIFTALKSDDEIKQAITAYEGKLSEKKGYEVHLNDGQASAVAVILQSTDRVVLVSGNPGAGKTTSCENIKDALAEQATGNFKVFGLSNDGAGSANLQAESGIKSQTIARFLIQGNKKDAEIHDPNVRELWIVDEASKIGSKEFSALLDLAEKRNAQLAFIGDPKQILSIGASQIFTDLLKQNLAQQTAITEVMRQRLNSDGSNQYAIDSATAMRNGEVKEAFDVLKTAEKLTTISDRSERLEYMADKYIAYNDSKETLCLVETNRDRIELNSIIRDKQKDAGQIGSRDVLYKSELPINLMAGENRLVNNYKAGNVITLSENMKMSGVTFKAGTKLEIASIDTEKRTISLNLNGENTNIKFNNGDREKLNELRLNEAQLDINVLKNGDKFTLSEYVQGKMAENEPIMFLKNDNLNKDSGIFNGVTGSIEKVLNYEKGVVQVRMPDDKIIQIDLNQVPNTNAQSMTVDKSQGQTKNNVIANLNNSDYNKDNVGFSRHRYEIEVVTSNEKNLLEHASVAQEKSSTINNYGEQEMSSQVINNNSEQQNQSLTNNQTEPVQDASPNKSAFMTAASDSLEYISTQLQKLENYIGGIATQIFGEQETKTEEKLLTLEIATPEKSVDLTGEQSTDKVIDQDHTKGQETVSELDSGSKSIDEPALDRDNALEAKSDNEHDEHDEYEQEKHQSFEMSMF